MLVLNQNELMGHIEVRLHIFKIRFAESFKQDNRYLFTGMQVFRANYFDDFWSDGLIAIVDQLFNEVKVN